MPTWFPAFIFLHCLEIVQKRSFYGLYFPVFRLYLNTEIYSVNLCIHSEYKQNTDQKSPFENVFHRGQVLFVSRFLIVDWAGVLQLLLNFCFNCFFLPCIYISISSLFSSGYLLVDSFTTTFPIRTLYCDNFPFFPRKYTLGFELQASFLAINPCLYTESVV